MSLLKSKQTWITFICIGAGLFMLAALAHVAQASECGDLAHFIGQNCTSSSSGGWDPMAELDNMGTDKADQSSTPTGVNWAKVSRQYRWNQSDLGNSSSSAGANSPQAARAASAGTGTNVELPANQSISAPVSQPVSKIVSEPVNYTEPKRSSGFYAMAAPLSDISKYDMLLDVSDGVTKFIPGAVHIDYLKFQNNGTLKPAQDLAKILGDAGISRNDSVLIYGECKCGLGPSVSTYVYWIMRYLGHDPQKVRVLDGGITDWATSHPVANESLSRPKTNYSYELKPELLATYDEVKSGQFNVVDARMSQDWGTDSILGSYNIPFSQVISNGRIKDETTLNRIFSGLRKDKPVTVYSNEGVQASLIWFSLETMGYKAKLYTWKDWTEHKN